MPLTEEQRKRRREAVRRYRARNLELTRERTRKSVAKHYAANPGKNAAGQLGPRERGRRIINEAKNGPCADCGGRFPPWVMDFHHVRGEKQSAVGKMVTCSVEVLQAEIAKCDLLCSNCHRERHWWAKAGDQAVVALQSA